MIQVFIKARNFFDALNTGMTNSTGQQYDTVFQALHIALFPCDSEIPTVYHIGHQFSRDLNFANDSNNYWYHSWILFSRKSASTVRYVHT